MPKRLYRSRTERMIAGVCGGLSEYFDVDPVFMRLAFILLAFMTGIGFLLYPLLWIIMPDEGSLERPPREVVRENLGRMRDDAERWSEELRRATGKPAEAGETAEEQATPSGETTREAATTIVEAPLYSPPRPARDRQFIVGVVLLLLGVLFLLQNLIPFFWAGFSRLWPVILVAIGGFLLYRQTQERR